jgi:tetratricopeptide (TPR) repeat protein
MKARWKIPILMLLLFTGVWLTYSNHFLNSFHFDDFHTIENNPAIRNLHQVPRFFTDGTTFSTLPSNQSYRPLVTTTLAIDYALDKGRTTFWFHCNTFLLFLVQGGCMFILVRALYRQAAPGTSVSLIALFTVAWYLLHPVNAETINYLIARSDTLSTLAVVLGLALYITSARSRTYYLYLFPVALGCLAKPTAVMFAPILACYVFLFESEGEFMCATNLRNTLSKTIPSILFCAAAYFFIRYMEPATWRSGAENTRWGYLITQPFVIFRYFYTFFLPVDLSADTDWKQFDSLTDIRCIIGFIFLLLLLFSTVWLSRKKTLRPAAFGLAWFLLALFPTSIVPLAEVMNDHRMFFPYAGLVISISWGMFLLVKQIPFLAAFGKRKDLLGMAAFFFLSLYAFGTHERNVVWRTEESLWKDVTLKSPDNGRGWMNYGLTFMTKGDYAGAENCYRKALGICPQYAILHVNMGILKEAMGQPAEAEQYFKNALVYGGAPASPNPECDYYYARFLKNQHRLPEALYYLNELLRISPGHLTGHYLILEVLQQMGQYEQVKQLASEALRLSPDDAIARSYLANPVGARNTLDALVIKASNNPSAENYLELSLAYYTAGNYPLCIRAAKEALKLKKDYAEAWNNIGAAYGQLHQWDEEIIACKEALHINPAFELAKNNLNWALQHKK